MSNQASRLAKLEASIGPPQEKINILHVIVDPRATVDRATEVLARGPDALVSFTRKPGETKEQMCERAERAMGWAKPLSLITSDL